MGKCISLAGLAAAVGLIAGPADAALANLAVTYTDPEIISGPVTFGLNELPVSVTSHFVLDLPAPSTSSTTLSTYVLSLADVQSGEVQFGDGDWTTPTAFALTFQVPSAGPVDYLALSYSFLPIDTLTAASGGILNHNFVLHVSGIDKATGEAVAYQYNTSTPVLTPAPEPTIWTALLLGFGLAGASLRYRQAVWRGSIPHLSRGCAQD